MNKESKIEEKIVASYLQALSDRMVMDRSFYHPRDVEIETIRPEGSDLEVRAYQQNGLWFAVAFAGKANRPLWNHKFRDRAALDRLVQVTVEDRKGHMEIKQKRQDERRQFRHTLKVGDILYSSWGYDQTNIDFLQVTEIGEKSVKIRPIEQKVVGGSTGSDNVVAVPNKFTGPDQVKIVQPGNVIRMTSYASAYPWDGKPKHQTADGWGH